MTDSNSTLPHSQVIHAPAHPGSHSLSVVIVSHREARHHLAKAITNRQHLEEMSRCVSLPSAFFLYLSPLSAWPCALHFRRLIAQQKLQLNTSKSLLQTNKPQPKVRAKQTRTPKGRASNARYAIRNTRYEIQDTRYPLSVVRYRETTTTVSRAISIEQKQK